MAWAQAYPARPVRIIVGFAPGGASDIAARLIAQWLSDRMGQQFIVDRHQHGACPLSRRRARLHRSHRRPEINAGLADPALRARLADLGSSAFAGSPADFAKFLAAETERLGKVVKFSGAKVE